MKIFPVNKYLFLLIIVFISNNYFSQRNSDKGDKYFNQNVFNEAIKYYQLDIKARDRKTSEYAMQKLADCYRITGEFEKAEELYKKILKKKKKKDPLCYLNYGLSLKNSAKYAEATEQFKEYVALMPEDPMGKIYLASCDSAQKWLDETIGKEVKNLEKINTELSEFSPVIYKDGKLFFSSSRIGSKEAFISLDGGTEMHRMDVFSINMSNVESKNFNKKNITNFKEINSPAHEGSACFSENGKEVYFTKTLKGKRDKKTNSVLSSLQIYYSRMDSTGKWSAPKSAFAFNSNDYSVGHPSLSPKGDTIYFMSDKPGGYGKTDIYYSVKQTNGEWGNPVNAGKEINTFGYELFPYISANAELYFSSNAHPGMGQLDIFKSIFTDGRWTGVQNLKPPFNSIGNDFGIVLDGKNKRGFFSSDRFNGKGMEDIYSFSDDVPLHLTFCNDTVVFNDLSVFDDIRYKLLSDTGNTEQDIFQSNDKFMVKLLPDKNYVIVAKKLGFPYNKIHLKLTHDTLKHVIQYDIKADSKQLTIKCKSPAIQMPNENSNSDATNKTALFETKTNETINSETSEGYTSFLKNLDSEKSYRLLIRFFN